MALTRETAQPYVDAYVDDVLRAAQGAHPRSSSAGWLDLRAALGDPEAAVRVFVRAELSHDGGRASQGAQSLTLLEACLRIFRRAVFEAVASALKHALDGGGLTGGTPRRAGALSANSRSFLKSMRRLRATHAPPLSVAQLRTAALGEAQVRHFEAGQTTVDMGDDISSLLAKAWGRLEPAWLHLTAESAEFLRRGLPHDEALGVFWHEPKCKRA
ncbi:hypothetical protein T492DRAFT_882108 [Pavlovales sp. CCMP2436]|nr:hypothetical protein T492DRAFT_882108 [Pavlovales sp. CCMP2436]